MAGTDRDDDECSALRSCDEAVWQTDRQTDRHSGITAEGEVSRSCRARYRPPLQLYSGSDTVRSARMVGGEGKGRGEGGVVS